MKIIAIRLVREVADASIFQFILILLRSLSGESVQTDPADQQEPEVHQRMLGSKPIEALATHRHRSPAFQDLPLHHPPRCLVTPGFSLCSFNSPLDWHRPPHWRSSNSCTKSLIPQLTVLQLSWLVQAYYRHAK